MDFDQSDSILLFQYALVNFSRINIVSFVEGKIGRDLKDYWLIEINRSMNFKSKCFNAQKIYQRQYLEIPTNLSETEAIQEQSYQPAGLECVKNYVASNQLRCIDKTIVQEMHRGNNRFKSKFLVVNGALLVNRTSPSSSSSFSRLFHRGWGLMDFGDENGFVSGH